jgi:hypothetical protein
MQVLQRQSDEAKESTCKEYDRFGSHSVLGSNKIPNSREKVSCVESDIKRTPCFGLPSQ